MDDSLIYSVNTLPWSKSQLIYKINLRPLYRKNSEIERRKRVSEEEHVHLKGRKAELERDLDFVKKELEQCGAMVVEKECQLSNSHYQLSDLAKAKECLEGEK